jgi:hypothetical protein
LSNLPASSSSSNDFEIGSSHVGLVFTIILED